MLTSRERMQRMLARRDHDRIPRFDQLWLETIQRWQTEGLEGDAQTVLKLLRSDVSSIAWSAPVPFPHRHDLISEDDHTQTIIDDHGNLVRLWKNRTGTPEHVGFGCDSRQKWENEYKPALLGAGLSVNPQASLEQFRIDNQKDQFCFIQGLEGFESLRQLCGDEVVLMAMLEDPEWIRDMSRTFTDLILADLQAVLDAGSRPHGVWLFGDLAYTRSLFFSPESYKELLWPDHKLCCDWAHANGMSFVYHTDGDVRPLLKFFVEAGFDATQPMEAKANMDVRELAPHYGKYFSFFGNIDMRVAIRGDADELEHELRTKLAAGMEYRAYAYHSDHSVPPQVSWQTYQTIIRLLDQYGRYE